MFRRLLTSRAFFGFGVNLLWVYRGLGAIDGPRKEVTLKKRFLRSDAFEKAKTNGKIIDADGFQFVQSLLVICH